MRGASVLEAPRPPDPWTPRPNAPPSAEALLRVIRGAEQLVHLAGAPEKVAA
ncbi:MAG TPA: hypothetical protein VFR23_14050 [Jiangellaceae bacterium]|nr:hypothetical protein [Jiangellaceae bacterium]